MTSKLKMHSLDLTEDNIAKIAALFPNCISESRDEQGRLKQVVDFDLLRQELSDVIVEGEQERYRLDWVGKKEAILAANAPIAKTLRPSREESVNFDTTENLFIEGDNLDALKLLQENYLGKVKMIYIDPPYNTGKDFIYNDDFAESSKEFFTRSQQFDEEGNRLIANMESNGRFHSDWLSMMYSRLKLARNLLTDDGVIFISCDDNEQANLKRLCDEVFGNQNFVAELIWHQGRKSAGKIIATNHEYCVIYAKSLQIILQSNNSEEYWKQKKIGIEKLYEQEKLLRDKFGLDFIKINTEYKKFISKLTDKDEAYAHRHYNMIDDNGIYFPADASAPDKPETRCHLPLIHPVTKKPTATPRLGWRYSEKKLLSMYENNLFHFGNDEKTIPCVKRYLKNTEFETVQSILYKDGRGSSNRLTSLFDNKKIFDFPKDEFVIKDFINLIPMNEANNLILDFFAGSATTAHAVMQLNAEDGGNRRFIMVQLPEATDEKSEAFKAGYPTIAEISKERIRRAAAKIRDDFADKLPEDWDGGFRVLKVDSTNMKKVYYRPDEVSQSDLLDMVSHIKEDRGGEDLLFQVMLDWGLPLSLPIQERDVDGKKVYFVGEKSSLGYALAACFDELNEAVIQAVAAETPQKFVSVEYAISQDADKTNIKEWFKQLSPETDVKFI